MNKKLLTFPIFGLFLLTLSACGSLPMNSAASQPQAEVAVAQASIADTAVPTAASLRASAAVSDLPESFNLTALPGSYQFTEGPAVDASGNVYFSDVSAGKIYKWTPAGTVSVFVEGLSLPNGLMFDKSGNLIACEGGKGRLISIDAQGQLTVLANQFKGVRFNEPNDLWIDAQGGIYFTDPVYQGSLSQDGEHVYYLSPDRSQLTRGISDMVKPNGLVGTADGKTLYVADYGAGQTFAYTINANGSLTDKRLFTATGSDGMDLDSAGNLYLTTTNQVKIFDPAGNLLRTIPTAENPTNVALAGTDTLFITARTAVYTSSSGSSAEAVVTTSTGAFTLTSPDLPADGRLPIEYTCDGAASTLALAWSGAPAGTVGYVVTMHHIAPDNAIHFYWEVYNLPADVTSLPKNVSGVGSLGTNSVNGRNEYTPPCSKGPDDKEYIYTVYALSAQPQFSIPAAQIDRAAVLAAIKDITLASAELHVVYARP